MLISIAIAPPFAGLHCFPKGRGFKQWTGDDFKALMKVGDIYLFIIQILNSLVLKLYLSALQGYLPEDVIYTFQALFEFCYIAQCDVITEGDLDELQDAITCFHTHHEVFSPIRGTNEFSLPRQHSIVYYPDLI